MKMKPFGQNQLLGFAEHKQTTRLHKREAALARDLEYNDTAMIHIMIFCIMVSTLRETRKDVQPELNFCFMKLVIRKELKRQQHRKYEHSRLVIRKELKLTHLNLEGCTVTAACLEVLSGLVSLVLLNLSRCGIYDEGCENLEGLIKLKALNLGFNHITDACLVHLKGMSSDNGSSSNSGGEGSVEPSYQPKKKKSNQTKWPVDKMVVTEIEEDGTPKDVAALRRMRRLAGLVATQRIPLKVEKITEYNEDQRREVFDRDVMTKLEFQPGMKKAACKTLWLMVASSRRDFRTMLTKQFVAEGIDPFDKYKFLQKEDWQAFCNLVSTQEAVEKSNKGKELRAKNKHDHHLGPSGYAVAIPKWDAQDAQMEAARKENPWRVIPGRSKPFLRARSSTNVATVEITFLQ
ncbi:hypothetical protein ACP4OV_016802 [Aristida adscensionis]